MHKTNQKTLMHQCEASKAQLKQDFHVLASYFRSALNVNGLVQEHPWTSTVGTALSTFLITSRARQKKEMKVSKKKPYLKLMMLETFINLILSSVMMWKPPQRNHERRYEERQ